MNWAPVMEDTSENKAKRRKIRCKEGKNFILKEKEEK
jgi:hypothetical protein